jgi:hypothetical protein
MGRTCHFCQLLPYDNNNINNKKLVKLDKIENVDMRNDLEQFKTQLGPTLDAC